MYIAGSSNRTFAAAIKLETVLGAFQYGVSASIRNDSIGLDESFNDVVFAHTAAVSASYLFSTGYQAGLQAGYNCFETSGSDRYIDFVFGIPSVNQKNQSDHKGQ